MKYQKHETAIVDEGAQIGSRTRIWHWVHICGGAKIGHKVSLGQNVFVGAGAVVNKNVSSYALMVGVPARQIGWMSEHGEKLNLPLSGNAQTTCKHSGKQYQLRESKLSVVS